MKKLFAVFLLLVMLIPPAFADFESDFVEQYNKAAEILFNLPTLGVPYLHSYGCRETSVMIMCMTGEMLGQPTYKNVVSCQMLKGADIDKFLLTAACILFTLDNASGEVDLYGNMFSMYVRCRNNPEDLKCTAITRNGVLMTMSRKDGLYYFMAVKN